MPKNPLTSRNDRDCPQAGKPPVNDWIDSHYQMPSILSGDETVEVMAADGETRVGTADSFSWEYTHEEESRITCWRRLANKYASLTADELLLTITSKRAAQRDHEDSLKEVKLDIQTAMNELNRRLTACDVTLNDVMKPNNGPMKR